MNTTNMAANIIMGIIGSGAFAGVVIMVFGRLFPKQETYDKKIKWSAIAAGKFCSNVLRVKLSREAADKIEEGAIITVTSWAGWWIRDFNDAMLSDNGKEDNSKPKK